MQDIELLENRRAEILEALEDDQGMTMERALALIDELAEIQTELDRLGGSLDDFADGRRLCMAGEL